MSFKSSQQYKFLIVFTLLTFSSFSARHRVLLMEDTFQVFKKYFKWEKNKNWFMRTSKLAIKIQITQSITIYMLINVKNTSKVSLILKLSKQIISFLDNRLHC